MKGSILIKENRNRKLEKNRPANVIVGNIKKIGSTRLERKSAKYLEENKNKKSLRKRLFEI